MKTLYTIGHSNHDMNHFVALLREHRITAIADVRQFPYSKYVPQFNRESLSSQLRDQGVEYVFLGHYLGARPKDPSCYTDGRVDFRKLCTTSYFVDGLTRVHRGIAKYRVALMCAEKDPIMCHRTVLVCRNMRHPQLQILHILEDAELEDNRDSETRLLQRHNLWTPDLFRTRDELVEEAYDKQGYQMAASATEADVPELTPA